MSGKSHLSISVATTAWNYWSERKSSSPEHVARLPGTPSPLGGFMQSADAGQLLRIFMRSEEGFLLGMRRDEELIWSLKGRSNKESFLLSALAAGISLKWWDYDVSSHRY